MTPVLPLADDRPIWDIWLSSMWLPAVSAAIELGLFEALAAGPLSATALAEQLDLKPQRCQVLLRMLDSLGLLVKHLDGYQLSPIARTYLLKESPFYWGPVLIGGTAKNPFATRVCEAVRNVPAGKVTGPTPADAWESGQLSDEAAGVIARYMNSHSLGAAYGAARSPAFQGVRRLLDVGGGSGCFSIAIAQHYPDLHATVMDLAPMCKFANEYIAAAGLGARIATLALDMFREPWPQGHDALFFSNIFHDWSPEVGAQLAAKSFAACAPGGRIYVHEMLLDDTGTQPRTTAAFSMMMLGATKGQQFTFGELKEILEAAGFQGIATYPTQAYYSLVSGRKLP
jgi:O-methyltransferase domain/Dimerisation domain